MTKSGLAEKINPDDLKSLRHYVIYRNETSKTDFLDYKDNDFQGIEDDTIYIILRKETCQIGHTLHVVLMPDPPKQKISKFPGKNLKKGWVSVIGAIEVIDILSKEKAIVQIKVTQYELSEISFVADKYSARQSSIDDIYEKGRKS